VAKKYRLTRGDCDAFAVRSHANAAAATAAGKFKAEIVAVAGKDKAGGEVVHDVDEGIRAGTTVETLGQLDTLVKMGVCPAIEGVPDGVLTAGNASQVSDGAAAVMIVNERGLRKLGSSAAPLAEIRSLSLAGTDPVLMLAGPIPATEKALAAAGLSIHDIDLFEVPRSDSCRRLPDFWGCCGALTRIRSSSALKGTRLLLWWLANR